MQVSKIALFCASLLPLAALLYRGLTQQLGANPIEAVIRDLGEWGLRFLLLTLTITPLRLIFGWHALARYRRMLGLFAFFYICLHLLTFFVVDLQGDIFILWKEILKRKFITVGMLAFLLLVPLAITSTDRMIKRLGGARWRTLHRLIYPAAVLACLHFYWMVKADKREPLIYAAFLALLLLYRALRKKRPQTA